MIDDWRFLFAQLTFSEFALENITSYHTGKDLHPPPPSSSKGFSLSMENELGTSVNCPLPIAKSIELNT